MILIDSLNFCGIENDVELTHNNTCSPSLLLGLLYVVTDDNRCCGLRLLMRDASRVLILLLESHTRVLLRLCEAMRLVVAMDTGWLLITRWWLLRRIARWWRRRGVVHRY